MALWNKVSSGFNTDDETVNFGARTVAENNGSIYETSTLATIQSDGEVVANPHILASVQYSMLCVAVDKSITIFSDISCEEIILNVGFDCLVTSYCLSQDGSFAFIALASGVLHCLHIASGGQQVFEENVADKFNDGIVKIFLHDNGSVVEILIVGASGAIYRITKLNLELADSALTNEDENALADVVGRIECAKIFERSNIYYAAGIDSKDPSRQFSIVTIGEKIHLWPNDRYGGHLEAFKYKKVQVLGNYGAMICLCNDGSLSIVCLETLLSRKIWDGPVADFVMVQDDSNDPYQILILDAPKNGAATTLLQYLSYPEFESKFEISVSTKTYLIDLVGSSLENTAFLEGIENSQGNFDTIRVKTIVENKPEYRLERLLKRGQFDEAEFFAKQYRLGLDSVNAARAAAFMKQLDPWSKTTVDSVENFEKFLLTLDKIEDCKYIYDCCTNALTSNYKQMRRLLLYARERINRNIEKTNSQDFSNLLTSLNANLQKLETFDLVQKTKINIESIQDPKTLQDIEEWIQFSRANLLHECIKHLSLGELEAAAVIWIRHLPELAPNIKPKCLQDILNSIPETMAPSNLWPWLTHFVPSVISLMPASLPEIIFWAYKKTRSLEKYYRKEWPQIGLDFAQQLIGLLSFQESSVSVSFNQQYRSKDSHFHHLMSLMQAMTDLSLLKNDHRIYLPLDIYLDDPPNVIHLLLDKAHFEAVPSLMDRFLRQYMLNHSLQNDQVLCSYIQKILRNSKNWWFGDKAPWEERVSVIIEFIKDVQNRLRQTVDVLKKAPVPWSKTIASLAERSCNVDHPLASQIRLEINGVAVKIILKKYGYAHIGLCTKLFRFIIKQNRENMINDICELTKVDNSLKCEAFSYYTNHYLNMGDIDKAMEIFHYVDDEVGQYCCEQIVNSVIALLSFKTRDSWLATYIEALAPIEAKLREFLSRIDDFTVKMNYSLRYIPILRRIYKLETQFNIWITLANFEKGRKEALDGYIDRLVSEYLEDGSIVVCCEQLEKVCTLLGLPPIAALLKFFDETKDIMILKRSITQLSNTGITSSEESAYLGELSRAWINNSDRDSEITMLLKKLCTWNLSICKKNQLGDAVANHNCVAAFIETVEDANHARSGQELESFDDQTYNLYTIYKDVAVSAENMLIPFVKDSLTILNFYSDARKIDEDSESHQETMSLVKSLMDRAHAIQNEYHDYALLKIATYVHYNACALTTIEPMVLMETQALLSVCVYTLLQKVVGARYLDVTLGVACLFMLADQEAAKWLKSACRSFRNDLARHRDVVKLGYEYARTMKLEDEFHFFEGQKLLHRWGRRLLEYKIRYKEVLTSNVEDKREILERAMHSKGPNLIPLLEDFCRDFGFEENDCFLLYLRVLMKTWQPALNLTMVNGRKELKISDSDIQDLNTNCKIVAARIKDKAFLKQYLTQLSPQINFYHYEVFLTILEIIGEKNVDRIQYFCFLQNYTRYGRPGELERDCWANICQDNSSLPPISQWRLPFLPKVDQFKLITPELNLKSYEKWLSIAPILKIQSHVICTLAVKGAVTEAWEGSVNEYQDQSWALYPRNSGLLKDIKKCIKCIKGPEGSYYGTAALYFVVNHTPEGADQVAAAQECFASAQLWEPETVQVHESREPMILKIKDKYLRLTSKHILYTHGLGEEKYLNLVGDQEKLVRELYYDPSITERLKGAIPHRPDINSAVNALGKLLDMNITDIRLNFLLEWLQPETFEGKHNDSVTMPFGNVIESVEDNFLEEDNLLRACYLLESGDQNFAKFLIGIGFGHENEDPGVRFRALQVLQSTLDAATLQDFSKHDPKSFRDYMKSLQYLNELGRLGLPYSVTSFEKCSKLKLAQILLKTQSYTPRALALILQICVDFAEHDRSLIDMTLQQMVKHFMVKELEKFLPVIGTMSHMIDCRGFITGWQTVIGSPFTKLDPRPSTKQISDCVRSLRLLQACPVVSKLEYKNIISRCIYCRQGYLAAAVLPFLGENDVNYALREIENNFKISEIIEDLKALTPKGILVVSQSIVILKSFSSRNDVAGP